MLVLRDRTTSAAQTGPVASPTTVTLSLWKAVLDAPSLSSRSPEERFESILRSLAAARHQRRWALFMSTGGKFAGGVFDGGVCSRHKTFARYTTRRKQGGSQASKDNQSGTSAPKSIGSQLRRNEQVRFVEDLRAVLDAWRDDLASCHKVFLFAPSSNLQNFYYQGVIAHPTPSKALPSKTFSNVPQLNLHMHPIVPTRALWTRGTNASGASLSTSGQWYSVWGGLRIFLL